MSSPARPKSSDHGHGDRSSLHRFVDALSSAAVWHRMRGDHVDFRCPLPGHEDRNASGSADWHPSSAAQAGSVRLVCHACGPECNDAIVDVLGLTWADLFDDLPAKPSASGQSHRRPRAARASAAPRPLTKQVDKSTPPNRWRGRLAATYPYISATGDFVAEFRRYESEDADAKTGKPRKRFSWRYRGPAGGWVYKMPATCPLYRLPDLLAVKKANEPAVVWLVEGEKNADDLARAGVVAVSAPNGAKTVWRPEYTEALTGTHVIIVADRDEPGLARAAQVGAALAEVTASLCAVRTPLDEPKADASDHLKAGLGLDEFELLPIDAAHGAPAVPGGGRPPLGRTGEVLPFRRPSEGGIGDGPGGRGGSGGGDDGDGAGPELRHIIREEYEQIEDDGGAVVQVKGRRGDPELIELLDAQVRIVRRIALDVGDDSAPRTTHVDLVASRAGQTVQLSRVPWDEFRKCVYLDRLPWPVAWNDTPSGRSKLTNAITRTSGPVPVVPSYGSLGWREIDGRWIYVHAGGGIDAAGSVPEIEVDVSPRLTGFRLPDPPVAASEFTEALRGVVDVLVALPARAAAPVLGSALRAIVGEQPRASVFVVGHTGSRKSGLAALAQQVFCPAARHNRMPVGAGEAAATVTAMEELMYQCGDMLLVADDLAPDRGAERAATRANELLRKAGNGEAKGRGARTGGLREDRPPRSLLMLTGEDGASSPSAESRTVYVPLSPGDIPLDVIKRLSARDLIQGRNLVGAAVARYLAGQQPVSQWVEELRVDYSARLLDATGADSDPDGLASRRADTTAELAVGWRALLDAALAAGALDDAAAQEVWARAWAGLVECLAGQVEVVDRRGLVDRAADLLRSVLRSGRGHLEAEHGGAPSADRLRACGWRRDGGFEDLRPGGDAVGWVSEDRRHVWLEPGAVFSAIERQGRAESSPLGVTPRALVAAMVAASVLSTEPVPGRRRPVPQVRRRAGGARQRVWELPWSWLWPDDDLNDSTNPSDPDGSDPTPPPVSPPPAGPTAPTRDGDATRDAVEPAADTKSVAQAAATAPEPPAEGHGSECDAAARTEPLGGRRGATEGRPVRAARYRAPGVVVDAEEAHLIGGEKISLPAEVTDLPGLLSWARGLSLGVEHAYSRDDAGQVWVLPDLARRLGLNKPPTSGSSRATTTHPVAKALASAGWELGKRGLQAWTHLWRTGQASLHVVIVPWLNEDAICNPKNPPGARALAERLELYSGLVTSPTGERQPYLYSVGGTGTVLLKLCRATARTDRLHAITPPPPAVEEDGKRWEVEWSWQRGPTEQERAKRFVIGWDANAQYLAAAANCVLGLGEPRHLTTVPPPGKRPVPGYWRVRRPSHDAASLLPDLFDPSGIEKAPDVWITTPTLVVARQHGMNVEPVEAWVWDEHTQWLQTWAHALRDARYTLAGAIEVDPADEDLKVVMGTVKLTYAAGIGMLGSKEWREGTELYRPDARHQVISLAKANLYRKMAKAAEAGWAPLGVHRDTVLFATDSDDPAQDPPPGFTRGTKLGEVKPEAITRMDRIADALAESSQPTPESFGWLND